MNFSSRSGDGCRRKSAIRSGLFAVSGAAAGLCSSLTARADITNGFSGFGLVNFVGQSTMGSVGYSSNGGTFTVTDNRGSEAASGFATATQNISSFDATYTYQETGNGPADGLTFCIQNNGTTALGNAGSGLGYSGIGNSVALEFNIYNGYTIGSAYNTGGGANNTFTGTGAVSLTSGDPIQVTLEYFNNNLTENLVDLKSNASYGRIFTGVNIPAALGGSNTGYVGFTGGTGGSTSTQQVSNFTFVSGTGPSGPRLFQPIALTGYNQQGVISVAGGPSSVTATMDAGTAKSGDTWYEKGWNTYNTSTGLPTSGSTFTSQYDSSHVFQMANYSANDVVLLSTASPTATMNFNTPSAYSSLSFLESCGHGPSSFKVTITYADGAPSTTGLSVITPDWFNGGPSAYYTAGRDTLQSNPASAPDSYAQGTGAGTGPNLYEEDLILPDSTDPILSLSLTFSGTNTATNMMIFAVSGVVSNSAPLVTYTGAAFAGRFDTSTINFSQNSGGTIVPVAFSNGDQVIFDDTASDTAHNITVATVAGGIKSGGLIFNNTTATNAYTFTGAGIGGPGGISVNGSGTVNLDNPNTFSGGAYINSGTLNIGSGGTLASTTISVALGATFSVNGGSLTGTGIALSDSGTVSYSLATLTLAGLSGNGVLTSTSGSGGTNLTLTGSTAFSGSMSLGNGSVTVNANGSTVALSTSNSYSGGTYLTAGALQIGNSSSLGSGTLHLQGGSFGATGGPVNFSNFITGSALVVPTGSTLLEISGANNNFTGPVIIQSGATLQVDTAGSIGGLNGAAGGSVIVSGGSLSINDTSGNLGHTGGAAGGAPITLQLSGLGVGNNGALTTPANTTGATWAGNITASGPATIAPGIGSTLSLTGAITGSGPILYASNNNDSNYSVITLAPPSATSNIYTGESQVASDYGGRFATLTVGLGNNNGFSTASGLNLITGGTGQVSVELNGYNQGIQYLTGGEAGTTFQVSNTAATTSFLTISNGNNAAGAGQVFATPIIGNIAVVKTGSGNQTLSGISTYMGGTTITSGTLSVGSSGALGSSTAFLNGGTLAFPAANLNNLSSFVVNGSAAISGNTATLTNNGQHEAGSVFSSSKATLNLSTGFTATYTMNLNAANTGYVADGIGFVLQNDPAGASALGNGGGGLGWQGIQNTFIAGFETYGYDFGGGGANDVEFGTNGTFSQVTTSGLGLTSQAATVTLNYNGITMSETIVGQGAQGGTYTVSFPVNLASVLGSNLAYVGFTGGTGDGSALQTVTNFSMTNATISAASITNPIVANANTASIIQVAVNTGSSAESFTSLTLQTGSKVTLVTANGSTGRLVFTTPSLSIAGNSGSFTAQLDIGNNDLDLQGANIGTVTSMLKQGYAGGTWNGKGIASNAAGADTSHLTALGVIVNDNGSGTPLYGNNGTISSTFDGAVPTDGDILVKYTYYGDANLDGAIDGSDYSLIDYAYATDLANPGTLTGWQNGDFNYDGVVDGSDYTLIDNAFNAQGASLGSNPLAQLASPTASVGTTAVPEPTTLGILTLASAGLLSRRKRWN